MVVVVLIGAGNAGCSLSRTDTPFAKIGDDLTGSLTGSASRKSPVARIEPTESDLAFARNAASDVLTKGDKDASQPWENPETGARGSVTPVAQAYSAEGRTCRDFLASYVNGTAQSWLRARPANPARAAGRSIH